MRNEIFPKPFWINKYNILVPHSDDGPYLNDLLMLLMIPDQGITYFKISVVIN